MGTTEVSNLREVGYDDVQADETLHETCNVDQHTEPDSGTDYGSEIVEPDIVVNFEFEGQFDIPYSST